ncbi:hypothetical protein VTK73DRAFT_7304 [Phialemonium thermophilum]|uniref:Uncharacterized protein n=1 Tax=Phialemonium thermophilum TaxID=223376 RepID=A0ABR3WF57_9PEZI
MMVTCLDFDLMLVRPSYQGALHYLIPERQDEPPPTPINPPAPAWAGLGRPAMEKANTIPSWASITGEGTTNPQKRAMLPFVELQRDSVQNAAQSNWALRELVF